VVTVATGERALSVGGISSDRWIVGHGEVSALTDGLWVMARYQL